MNPFEVLPDDVHYNVLQYMIPASYHTLRFTCKRNHQLVHAHCNMYVGNTVSQRVFSWRILQGFFGRQEMIDWALSTFVHFDFITDKYIHGFFAASESPIELFKAGVSQGKWEWSPYFAADCARGGNLDTLKWIHETKFDFGNLDDFHAGARDGGHLEVIKWMYANISGFSWVIYKPKNLLEHDIELLEWAFKNGCDFSGVSTWRPALQYFRQKVLDWGVQKGIPDVLTNGFEIVGDYGNLSLANFLVEKGFPIPVKNLREAAVSYDFMELLIWVHEKSPEVPYDPNLLSQAVVLYRENIVKWLLTHALTYHVENVRDIIDYRHVGPPLLAWFDEFLKTEPKNAIPGRDENERYMDPHENDYLPQNIF